MLGRVMDILNKNNLEKIYRHAANTYPEECCGFIFADALVHEGLNIQNELHARSPAVYRRNSNNGYTFAVADTLKLHKSFRGDNPVAIIYHSHPDVGAYFSQEDEDKALFLGQPIYPVKYLVVDVRNAKACGAKLFEWTETGFVCSQEFSC